MLEQVAALRGELYKARISGHGDSGYAASIVRYIQKEDSDAPRPQIPTAQMTYDLSMAAMSRSATFLMWLKNRGDDYLMEGMYFSASMCYDTVCNMETFWLKTSPLPAQRTFWTESSTIFGAFGVALEINSAIAYMAGDGNGFGAIPVRGTTMQSHYGALLLSSAAGLTLGSERFMELNIVIQLYIVLAQDPTDAIYISSITDIRECWEEDYDQDGFYDLSCGLGSVYKTVERLLDPSEDERSMAEGIEELKIAARSVATVAPLKWAVSESMFSHCIQHDLSFLATVKLLLGSDIENAKGYAFEIPAFDQPTEEALQGGEDEMRYLF
jgi:hypothetical protein